MAVWLAPTFSHQNSKRCRSPSKVSQFSGPACNAAEAVAVNVQQEELTNAEDSIECHWPVHCHHTNQTHVLHWHQQHPERCGRSKENCGFCCHLPWQKPSGEFFRKGFRELEANPLEFHEYDPCTVMYILTGPSHTVGVRLNEHEFIPPFVHCFSLPHSLSNPPVF